ncbi:hypothetical protein A9Q91_05550 [Candidatus Gracilibacteria bacterium 28_42_T64]|nr:hypothetical protein A9Q91_05550 [Candidatus Gracilibacteria bacterium 28_42_T64]
MAKKTNSKASTVLDMLDEIKQEALYNEELEQTKTMWKSFIEKIEQGDIYKKLGKPKFPGIDELIKKEFEVSRVSYTKDRIEVVVHLFSEEISFSYTAKDAPKELLALLKPNREEGTAPKHDSNRVLIPHSNP